MATAAAVVERHRPEQRVAELIEGRHRPPLADHDAVAIDHHRDEPRPPGHGLQRLDREVDGAAAVDPTGAVPAMEQGLLVDRDDELRTTAAAGGAEHEVGETQRLEELVAQQRIVGRLAGVLGVEARLGRSAQRLDQRHRALGVEPTVDVPHAVAAGPRACADVSPLTLQPVDAVVAVVALDVADRGVEAGAELLGRQVRGHPGERFLLLEQPGPEPGAQRPECGGERIEVFGGDQTSGEQRAQVGERLRCRRPPDRCGGLRRRASRRCGVEVLGVEARVGLRGRDQAEVGLEYGG